MPCATGVSIRKELTPAAALELCVDLAIEKEVVAVLFAGDIVESTNARFEAMVPLEASVRRLLDAGIEVIAVAGNHDVEALPRLAGLVDGFRLLGAGGTWESLIVTRDQVPVAEIVGWSFGERHVRQSPVAHLLADPLGRAVEHVPRIGLLHADLGASGGTYAPVRQAELDDAGCDAWLLGHIHKPSLADTRGRIVGISRVRCRARPLGNRTSWPLAPSGFAGWPPRPGAVPAFTGALGACLHFDRRPRTRR